MALPDPGIYECCGRNVAVGHDLRRHRMNTLAYVVLPCVLLAGLALLAWATW